MPFAQDGAGVGRGSFLLGGSLIVRIAAGPAPHLRLRQVAAISGSASAALFLLLLLLLLLLPRLLFLLFLVVFQASGLSRFSPKLLCGLVGKWPSPLRDSGFVGSGASGLSRTPPSPALRRSQSVIRASYFSTARD